MAISTYHVVCEPITLPEFIEYVAREVDLRDDDSVVAAAPMLEALAQNKQLLVAAFEKELLQHRISGGAAYSPSSLVLGHGRGFVVRANLWPPAGEHRVRTLEEALFSYSLPHDHNFSFLTANYFGPGYETEIWEIVDPDAVVGHVGEPIELRFLERTRLHGGKQMFFRRCRDIHVQLPPAAMSASINLMMPSGADVVADQYLFDLDERRISGHPQGCPATRRVFLMEVAGMLEDESLAPILHDIARLHPCQRTRAEALRSALRLAPTLAESLHPAVLDDPSPHVRAALHELTMSN